MECPKCNSKEMIPSGSQYYDCNAWVCDCGYEIAEWGSLISDNDQTIQIYS